MISSARCPEAETPPWKQKMKHLILFSSLAIFSCNSHSEKNLLQYEDGKQLLTLNELSINGQKLDQFSVEKIAPDTIVNGDEFRAKLFLTNKNINIVAAYFNCLPVDNPTVDTATNILNYQNECDVELPVENDTIYIAFRIKTMEKFATESVPYTSGPITILTKDKEMVYRTQEYKLDLVLVEN